MLFDKDDFELMDSVVISAINNGSNWYGQFTNEQNKPSYIHRLIYESNYGKIDERFVIDHISGNSLDNRKVNLRTVPCSINSLNKKEKHNESGYIGITRIRTTKKWKARIKY